MLFRSDKQRLQEEINNLERQKSLFEGKYENASEKLQGARENLDAEKAKQVQAANAQKPANPNRGKSADFKIDATTNSSYIANGIPMDEPLPSGLIYRIQLGVYSNPVKAENFKGLNPLAGHTISSNKFSYATGIFYSYDQALKAKDDIQKIGIKDAFIVAYQDGEHISVAKAIRME